MGTPETLARRERRRRQAVRAFLLDSLFSLDGVEYVRQDAQEGHKDAPGTPNATAHDSKPAPREDEPWDESTPRRECGSCGRVDALKGGLCRYCHAEMEAEPR